MKPTSSLAFHLAFWGMIALVLFFSSPSKAAVWELYGQPRSSNPDALCQAYWDNSMIVRGDEQYMPIGTWRDGQDCWREAYPGSGEQKTVYTYYRCDDGSYMSSAEIDQGYCDNEDPPATTDPQCEQKVIEYDASGSSTLYCVDGSVYTTSAGYDSVNCGITDTPQGIRFEVEGASYGWATATGDACTVGDENDELPDAVNPEYNLPVLPKTDQTVEINGQEIPLVESGCGEIAGTLTCTNAPNCGEFNGDWVCTGPDNGTPGVPAQPDVAYDVSGTPTADRAGDQYYYNSSTVQNSTNLGQGGTSDPSDDGKADARTDGSDSGDPNAPLGRGSCPTGYVQTGVTALGDGSTEANCVPAGDDPDWMGLADKLDMSDEMPAGWLDAPEIPGISGPSSSCPPPHTINAFGTSFEISFGPFCSLADMLRPFLILIAYLTAGWFVFRIVGGGDK